MKLSTLFANPTICHICFNEMPETSVNAFSRADIHALWELLDRAEARYPEARILVFSSQATSSKGKPIFCAGADLKERPTWTAEEVMDHVDFERSLTHRLRQSPLLVACVVSGYALGFGAELCAASDLVLATPNARFGFPECQLGIVPGAGGLIWALSEAQNPKRALNHLILGDIMEPQEALLIGLVQEILPSETAAFEYLLSLSEPLTLTSSDSQKALKQARSKVNSALALNRIEHDAYADAWTQTHLKKNNEKSDL